MSVQASFTPPLAPPWRTVFRRHRWSWRVVDEGLTGGSPRAKDNIEADAALGLVLAEAPADGPLYRIWTSRPALVATRRETRHPRYEEAARAAAGRGWPVVVRDSGGTLVPHLDGSLHLSLLLPREVSGEPGERSGKPGEASGEAAGASGDASGEPAGAAWGEASGAATDAPKNAPTDAATAEPTTEEVYALLCEPVLEALARVGIEAGYGAVPNSFCDGRHNLVARGRKIAGTSQRWRGGIPGSPVRPGYVLAHMTLFVEGDMAAATHEVNRFLAEAGSPDAFDPDAVAALAELDPAPGSGKSGTLLTRVHAALRGVLEERDRGVQGPGPTPSPASS